MLVNINKATIYFLIICFIGMTLPYFIDFGSRGLFFRDFYAKRVMTFLSFPFFILILLTVYKNKIRSVNKNSATYFIILCVIFINSILFKNRISLVLLDAFIVFLPLAFYLLVYKTSFKTETYIDFFPWLLLTACVLVVIGIKLQFSYFSMLGIVFIIFLTKTNIKSLVFILILPILVVNTLIGKSALLILVFLVSYFFFFDKKLVSRQKKIYLALIPSILIIIGTVVFWQSIKQTGAYKNTYYFITHTDFKELKFSDMSTGHRIYEAKQVLANFEESNIYVNLFGNGMGATIDLSETTDVSVSHSNSNLEEVRHIHIGLFAVLYRYGIFGVLIYLLFIKEIISSCRKVLKNSTNYSIILSALYLLIIVFDSFISFPHMASNFMFWLITFIIFKESKKYL